MTDQTAADTPTPTPTEPQPVRRDLTLGLIGAGVYLVMIAAAVAVPPLLPAAAEGAIGVYQRVTIAAETGDDVSLVAPQGWYLSGEWNTDVDDETAQASGILANVVTFDSPDGSSSIVVTGFDAEQDPDSVLFLHTCKPASDGAGESCADVQLLVSTPGDDADLASAISATRAVAASIGVVS